MHDQGTLFQSPFPVRGTTEVLPVPLVPHTFQSPFPVRGTTKTAVQTQVLGKSFNPRSP